MTTNKTSKMAAQSSSSDDGDSDAEKNFALLTQRGEEEFSEEDEDGGEEEEEDEEEGSATGEEVSGDGGEEEEEDEEEGSATGEEGSGESEGEEEDDDTDDEDDEEEPEETAGGSGEIQTREDIKTELSNMAFEDVMKLQNKVGTKVYNQVAYGNDSTSKPARKRRLNKNRPTEISSKRKAPFLRQVVSVKKPTLRDPRFDDLSGEYKPEIFEGTYKFINDIKQREREVVEKQLKKTNKKNNTRKENLQFLLKRMDNQERARKIREQQRERELQFKREQRERAGQGNKPFFLKSSEKRKLELAEKYTELKKSGKLENFLSKKRKRNAGKDKRRLPMDLQQRRK